MSIECMKYKPVNKGVLLGYADIYVPKMGLEIYGCSFFQKDGRRWINFPSKEYKNDLGETKYASIVRFREASHMEAFTEACKKAIEKKCAEAQPVQQSQEEEELPF